MAQGQVHVAAAVEDVDVDVDVVVVAEIAWTAFHTWLLLPFPHVHTWG